MGSALAAILIVATLSACQPSSDPENAADETRVDAIDEDDGVTDVTVTAAFEPIEGGTLAVDFIPDADAPWTGLVVTAPRDGGLDLYNTDGENVARITGPRLTGLAVSPNFALRGESLPLILGVDGQAGHVRGYVLLRSGPDAIEAPLSDIQPSGGASNLCFVREGAGFVDIAVLGRESVVELWRISDDGGDVIGAERLRSTRLNAPARTCTAQDGDVFVSGPTSSLTRLDSSGAATGDVPMNALNLASGIMAGRPVVLAADGNSETLRIFDARTLDMVSTLRVVTGLSTPGVTRPGALAISDASYGGMSYQSGLIAVVDEADGRVRVIARESFARDITLANQ